MKTKSAATCLDLSLSTDLIGTQPKIP